MHAQIAFSAVALAATLATAAIAQGGLNPVVEPDFQVSFAIGETGMRARANPEIAH